MRGIAAMHGPSSDARLVERCVPRRRATSSGNYGRHDSTNLHEAPELETVRAPHPCSHHHRHSGHYARVGDAPDTRREGPTDEGVLPPMSLDYAADHLTAAVRSLATSEFPLAERLQTVWDEHVQMVWMKPCLTRDLLREFRDLWQRYTAPSDDRRSTKLRGLTREELVCAVDELVSLATNVAVASTRASGDERLATLADLA